MEIRVDGLKPVELGTLKPGDGFYTIGAFPCDLHMVLDDPDNDSGVSVICFKDFSAGAWQRDTLVNPVRIETITVKERTL